jgi:hypothetical protein
LYHRKGFAVIAGIDVISICILSTVLKLPQYDSTRRMSTKKLVYHNYIDFSVFPTFISGKKCGMTMPAPKMPIYKRGDGRPFPDRPAILIVSMTFGPLIHVLV